MEYKQPLWIITFDPKTPEKSFQERAVFSSFPNQSLIQTPSNLDSGQQALEFLSKVNTSLKNITEAYLAIAESNKELKPKADEIRERLSILNQWLEWLRCFLKPPPEKEDID